MLAFIHNLHHDSMKGANHISIFQMRRLNLRMAEEWKDDCQGWGHWETQDAGWVSHRKANKPIVKL